MGKKQFWILLCTAVVICIGAAVAGSAKAQQQSAASSNMWANDPNLASVSANSTSDALRRLVISIIIVAIIGSAAIWASKKWLPKIAAVKGKNIRLIETTQIGPHKALHIVEIGSQKFLIGSSSESVRMLADVTLALTDEFSDKSSNEKNS